MHQDNNWSYFRIEKTITTNKKSSLERLDFFSL